MWPCTSHGHRRPRREDPPALQRVVPSEPHHARNERPRHDVLHSPHVVENELPERVEGEAPEGDERIPKGLAMDPLVRSHREDPVPAKREVHDRPATRPEGGPRDRRDPDVNASDHDREVGDGGKRGTELMPRDDTPPAMGARSLSGRE